VRDALGPDLLDDEVLAVLPRSEWKLGLEH
jgi:hypothetical protein